MAPKNGPFDYFNGSLQGSRSQDILWLVDGVRITNRLYNTTTPLDTVPAHMVERIEVLKGGQGIFYGTQSVAGVINVVTKSFSRSSEGQLSGEYIPTMATT
jgi:vitamin B12 transporter